MPLPGVEPTYSENTAAGSRTHAEKWGGGFGPKSPQNSTIFDNVSYKTDINTFSISTTFHQSIELN